MMHTMGRARRKTASAQLLQKKKGMTQQEQDLEQAEDNIEFAKRDLPTLPFNTLSFLNYAAFLICFLFFTTAARTDSYYFGQYVRESAGVQEFMKIKGGLEYRDWLEYHFLPGMHYNSYNRSYNGAAGIFLVGPPRLRAVRSSGFCETGAVDNDEMRGKPVQCFKLDDEKEENLGDDTWFAENAHFLGFNGTLPTNQTELKTFEAMGGGRRLQQQNNQPPLGPQTATQNVTMHYQTANQLKEDFYSSPRETYTGGGHVVQNVHLLFKEPASIFTQGTEFYPFAHYKMDSAPLFEAGWQHPTTRALFHDFTLYSATKDCYIGVRLVMEIGLDHGLFIPTKHVKLIWLQSYPDQSVIVEYLFYTFLFMLLGGCVKQFIRMMQDAPLQAKENIVAARFRLRVKILQHGAFTKLFPYRPRVLMQQIIEKLQSADESRRFFIAELNAIGCEIPRMHKDFQSYSHTNAHRIPSNLIERSEAVEAILTEVEKLLLQQRFVDTLRKKGTGVIGLGPRDRVRKFIARVRVANRVYMSDIWRVLDIINYALFILTGILRLRLHSLSQESEELVKELPAGEGVWELDSAYINFYRVALLESYVTYINSFNAALTWMKIFKYLNFFPNMQILTRTLAVAAMPLAWFSVVISIVLLGCAQGFFLAFGLDIVEYRSFGISVLALLRMAVGDFDYTQLEESHHLLTPVLFWVYIFLVFFILMSVFIALISESYEQAKFQLREASIFSGHKPEKDDETMSAAQEHTKQSLKQFKSVSAVMHNKARPPHPATHTERYTRTCARRPTTP